jgi:hypothetical protein
MKKGIERDKQTLVKIVKGLYNVILNRKIPLSELKNLKFDSQSRWVDLLETLSSALKIDYNDLDEISFYTLLVLENIYLIKENNLNEETINVPKLQEFSFEVEVTTSEVWERTYVHTFKAYDYSHSKKALQYDLDSFTTTPWDGQLISEDGIDTSDIEFKIL